MRFLFLALLSIFSSTALGQDNYSLVIEAAQFTQFRTVSVENITISYAGTSESDRESILYHSKRAYDLLDIFYENPDSCRDTSLNIYHIEKSVINNRNIMHFVNWDAIGNQSLYGYYDARMSPRGTATIFVKISTDRQSTIDTTVHEIAHHYQYTHCISQSESEAYQFENFYRDRNT